MSRRARPASDDARLHVANRLHSAAIHLLRRARRVDAESHLPAPQLSALSVIVYAGPITLGALAAAEQVRPPTMTRLVAAMEAAGLVERRPDTGDRRVTRIAATATGRRLLETGRDRRIAVIAEALSDLPASELAQIAKALDAIEQVAGSPKPRAAP
ncbi:MAG TPA: MarR family transcriptional regulator [Gemmatimonadaceae bacterium]|nr:MarR family transcriptional regulator [Gemmatimonadaceae bacterium]